MDQDLYWALQSACVEFIAHSAAGECEVNVEFTGWFESRAVVWLAAIRCLPPGAQQYIDVQVDNPAYPRIDIGLPLTAINVPDILKTIMLVRQYKNLHRGRHEFSGGRKNPE
ncbi:MAG TPA: hypothetical protein VIM41_14055 [Gammaproteobacteria bacterium]